MLRLWCRVRKHNKIIEETVTESSLMEEQAAVAEALQAACLKLDIARPLWLSLMTGTWNGTGARPSPRTIF